MQQSSVIICPHCNKEIELTSALSHQIGEKLAKDFEKKLKDKDEELLREKRVMWEKAQAEAKKRAEEKSNLDLKSIKEELAEKEKKLEEANKMELEMRKERRKLEEDRKELELTSQRKLDEMSKKLTEDAYKKAQEELHLKEKEKDKVINDLKKALEDAQRKASQGSQQLQGEVQELELEEMLRSSFPYDEIAEVPKGIRGADALQYVRDKVGRACGTIIWESKRTKQWTEGWVSKLKDDQRTVKAEVAVLVSDVLPAEIAHFGYKNGIWVTDRYSVLGLCTALRMNLIQLMVVSSSQTGKKEKIEILYQYITGVEFRQKVEAIVESFSQMKQDLEREKRSFTKMWATREKQISQVFDSTIGMYGELQGIIGGALPEIKNLELPDGTDSTQEELV